MNVNYTLPCDKLAKIPRGKLPHLGTIRNVNLRCRTRNRNTSWFYWVECSRCCAGKVNWDSKMGGGGGRMWKGNEINNLSKKTTFKIHKYEMYPIEFTTMLFIWHGNELRACFLQVCGIAATCCPSLNKFPPLSCDRKNRFRRWDGRRNILSSLLNLTGLYPSRRDKKLFV